MKIKLLYVEDERDLGNVTKQYLELMHFDVDWHMDSTSAFEAFRKGSYHLSLIDIGLADQNGYDLADRMLRHDPNAYFIFLTARALKQDRIHGLKLGAIDYITKPFDIAELVLRIQNIVSKQKNSIVSAGASSASILVAGDVTLNFTSMNVTVGTQKTVTLTVREAELLRYFLQRPNEIVNRKELLVAFWGENDYFLGRSLDVFISRLRKMIAGSESVKIENLYGVGFMLVT